MSSRIKSHFIIAASIIFFLSKPAYSQFNQTLLTGINESNKNLIEISSREEKEFFPVMLAGFERERENRPWHADWNKDWGFNIVQSWHGLHFDNNSTTYKAGKDSVLSAANDNNLFVAFDQTWQKSKKENAKLLILFDESIHDGYNPGDLAARKNKLVERVKDASDINDFIWFANFSTRPFFVRYETLQKQSVKKEKVFESKMVYKYNNKSSTMSYDEAFRHVDIIGFDFYPWGHNGNEMPRMRENSFQSNFMNTSIGEFTGLLKKNYPDKAIWTYIQTVPFHPYTMSENYDDPGKEYYITGAMIRHLTFSAIINGADGIIFWGQTRYQESNSLGGKLLHEAEESLWRKTLEQSYELKMLQTQDYHSILLVDNLKHSYKKNGLVEYCYKKVKDSSTEFYLFITTTSTENITERIDVPEGFVLNENIPELIGEYSGVPEYKGSGTTTKDYGQENPIASVAEDGKSFLSNMKPYGTNIFYVSLSNDQSDL